MIKVTYTYGFGTASNEALLIGNASALLASSICYMRLGKGLELSQEYWNRGLTILNSIKRFTVGWG